METIKVYAAIIGGGASGLMCGCIAAKKHPDKKIVIIERDNRVGKKILVSGNSRCNLTNINASKENYNSSFEKGIDYLLKNYPPQKIIDYFKSIGLMSFADNEGRVYPLSKQSTAVLSVLRNELKRHNVDEICDCEVLGIAKCADGYKLRCGGKTIIASKVVIATGGKNNYAQKVIGDTHAVAKAIGHKISRLTPSLSPVKVKSEYINSLKGIRAQGKVTAVINGKSLRYDSGEIQFTNNALSGICVFNISGVINECDNAKIIVQLLPDCSFEEIKNMLYDRKQLINKDNVQEIFTGLFHKNIGVVLLKESKVSTNISADKLTDKDIKSLAATINKWVFDVAKSGDFSNAQVTRGGICGSQINEYTMESKLCKDIYICGEAIDVDGDCGGYNLQFAFSSGMCAGENL